MPDSYLLKLVKDGKVLAEAPLIIHDAEAAWSVFSETFGMMAGLATGSLYNTMRLACDAEALAKAGTNVGISIDVGAPQIVVPQGNGHMNGAKLR